MTPTRELRKLSLPRSTIREEVLVNPGNRYLEYISATGEMIRLPNVIREFDPTWEDLPTPARDTVIVERNNVTYAVGNAAKHQSGSKSAFDKGKLNLLSTSIFAALEPTCGCSSYRIENLKIAVPDTRNSEAKAKCQDLVGTFEYIRNGEQFIVTIAKVTLIEEATAAYTYGITHGLYQWTDAINGVIDFGGGTSSGRLYSAEGVNLRDASITLPGTNALAQAIQARLLKETGISVELSQVMDGIESGSYKIGRNGASFLTHFASCREQWIDDIRSKAAALWQPYLADLGEVLLVGGSASLATSLEERTKGRFKIAVNPQDTTILGMAL
ncbi:ParM/StbA family protein [Kovacikia minuta CCNUW1]|uniref:ParM/StbA family protein n=1 Tax=Kovacikia minuta TaxID=2931930 RepID=UPI001CCB6973|nr:ParM/StbA family protein [Kovacikia minuta]UBF26415.1 ParM/StbA family protein [Kovacikia minuta CCNUW1]